MSEVSTYRSEIRVRQPEQVPVLLEALGQAAKAVGASVAAMDQAANGLAGQVSALNQGIDRLSTAFNRGLAKIVCGSPAGSGSARSPSATGSVGVRIGPDGRVHFEYDATGASAEMARRLERELECRYRAIAVARFFRKKGYPFQVIPGDGRITILSSVPHTNRKVAAVIDEQGNIALDHHQFQTNACVPHRQELLRLLALLGIELEATSRRPKGDEGGCRARTGPQVNV
jgi:hypothetical protein